MPRLEINLQKIKHNTQTIVELCKSRSIDVVGVTKGVSAITEVAKAMLDGGVCGLADARLKNIKKLRAAGITSKIMLMRLPRLSRTSSLVKLADTSLNSEWHTIRSINKESHILGKTHEIILMVDVGDLREGIMYNDVICNIKSNLLTRKISLHGIGTTVGCYGGVLPTGKNMGILARLSKYIEDELSVPLPVVSVGGTNCLKMIEEGTMPSQINQIRIGEGILLGKDGTRNSKINGTWQDAFELVTEIVEIKDKPSEPIGKTGQDAFGKKPAFKNHGIRRKALIALGKQDVRISGVIPVDDGIKVIGGSSDYLILDITESRLGYKVGDQIRFHLLYSGLLSVCTSPFVNIVFLEDKNEI